MAKEKSVPAQTSKDAEKDSLAAAEMILSAATLCGDSTDTGCQAVWCGGHAVPALHRNAPHFAAWHPQPA
jgi:hypothetical protein